MAEMYICLCKAAEAATALMVRYTWHLQTPVVGLLVLLLPAPVQPGVHNIFPAIGAGGAPAWNYLQDIK
jgi:hypothetical protein